MSAAKTLFHPFEAGLLEVPSRNAPALFLGAEPGFRLPDGLAADIRCVQGFRPDFLALQRAGHAVKPQPEGESHDLALVLLGRHRGRNELFVADAIERTRQGGLVVVAGGKEDGAASLRLRVAKLLPLDGHAPKHHGVVFWFRVGTGSAEAAIRLRADNPAVVVDGRFETAPGMFSHDRVDAASRLLARNLPADVAGDVADFGAGWGFLAVSVAERFPAVRRVDLYEADFESAAAARSNIARLTPRIDSQTVWADLETEPPARRYDLIVMNPPFHRGRAAEPAIGQAMIAASHAALRPRGRLAMVANRQLPYEATLAARFSSVAEVARDTAFKVFLARR
ncbi:MAG: class I SAM-dependent methyltransferase [Rhizobiaceae bacterium]